MLLRSKGFWGALALVTYACLASAASVAWAPLEVGVLAAFPFVLALLFRATSSPIGAPEAPAAVARPAAHAAFTGLLVLVAANIGSGSLGLVALAHVGAGVACVGGAVAVARAPGARGLVPTPSRSQKLDAAVATAFVWSIAIALPLFAALSVDPTLVRPVVIAFVALFSSTSSIVFLLLSILRALSTRRFDLGVRERLLLPLLLGGVALSSVVVASALDLVRPETALPFGAATVAAFAALASATNEADAVARGTRLALGVALPVATSALAGAYVATRFPTHAALATVAASAAAAGFGLLAPRISRRAAPEGHKWLDTLKEANSAAMSADPEPAIERALGALARNGRSEVTLYLVDPAEALTADRGGHVRRETATLAPSIVQFAREEPERILRREALTEAAVRRADAKRALEWMTERRAEIGVALFEGDDPCALLCIAETDRTVPWSLEEVRALRALGDRLAAVIAVLAKLRRSWERERNVRDGQAALSARIAETEGELGARADSFASLLERLARPAKAAAYGPAARVVVEQLERWASRPTRLTLLTAPGIDAVAWAALFHLAGPAKRDAFVVADGSARELADLMLWRSETESPLVRARGGTLVLLDPQLLNKLVQSYIGVALDASTNLVLVVPRSLDVLVGREEVDPHFADAAGENSVVLPRLRDRGEDLRALTLLHLSTLGARFADRPIGLEPDALALLVDHDWPGNDAELVGLLTRALVEADGANLTEAHVARLLGLPNRRATRKRTGS